MKTNYDRVWEHGLLVPEMPADPAIPKMLKRHATSNPRTAASFLFVNYTWFVCNFHRITRGGGTASQEVRERQRDKEREGEKQVQSDFTQN